MGNSIAASRKHNKKTKPKIVLFGLSSSGKSTLLHRMKFGEAIETYHDSDVTIEELQGDRFQLSVWDVGMRHRERVFMRMYLMHSDVIVYVIDSADTGRLEEAKDEIHDVMFEKDVQKMPLLILANKQDLPGCLTPDELAKELELDTRKMQRRFAVLPICATSGEGLETAFHWVEDAVASESGSHYVRKIVEKEHVVTPQVEEKGAEKRTDSTKWKHKRVVSSAVMFAMSLFRGRFS